MVDDEEHQKRNGNENDKHTDEAGHSRCIGNIRFCNAVVIRLRVHIRRSGEVGEDRRNDRKQADHLEEAAEDAVDHRVSSMEIHITVQSKFSGCRRKDPYKKNIQYEVGNDHNNKKFDQLISGEHCFFNFSINFRERECQHCDSAGKSQKS